jgi:hypothetical protein
MLISRLVLCGSVLAFSVAKQAWATSLPNIGWNEALASKLSQLSISCTQKESPHEFEDRKLLVRAREAHPAFFGCYDWHSAVHGHWAMIKVLKSFPNIPERQQIETILDAHLKSELIQKEVEYFKQRPRYELPYGYGWFLRLSYEIRTWKSLSPERRKTWLDATAPLEAIFSERLIGYLNGLSRPIRNGDHGNTAFSLIHAFDYASFTNSKDLLDAITKRSKDFYGKDQSCPVTYEPSGYDFISPCLAEADLMRRVLTKREFKLWLSRFDLQSGSSFLHGPVFPRDKKDPYLGHLVGLMFHKAWVFKALGFSEGAKVHEKAGLETMFGSGYGGEHWLATFAIYHFSATGAESKY